MATIAVLGAGFGGLTAAALLAKQGHDVTIYEKTDTIGGRAYVFNQNGYQFDMGPSWYMMPEVFERFFEHFNKKVPYKLTRLDPSYRIFFSSEDMLDVSADLNENYALFDRLEENGAQKLAEYLAQAEYQYTTAMNQFIYRPYLKHTDMLDPKLALEGAKLKLYQSMHTYIYKQFSSDKARKILLYTLVFLGGDPKRTPSLYSLMSHVDFNLGVYYPQGGMHTVAKAIAKEATTHGVKIKLSEPVTHITTNKGLATHIQTTKGNYPVDAVVANADYHHVETQLLDTKDQSYPEKYWKTATIAPSGIIISLGINKKLPQLDHHNLFFAHDWETHFANIFEKPDWPQNPSYYVCCPSKTDPKVAPKGHETLFILVPVASGLDDTDKEKYADKIITHLESLLKTPLKKHIKEKVVYAHTYFSERFNAYKGTALGLSHTLLQTASFRPRQKSKKIGNLYYAGQYTHPGIGVPMTVISGEIVASIIK